MYNSSGYGNGSMGMGGQHGMGWEREPRKPPPMYQEPRYPHISQDDMGRLNDPGNRPLGGYMGGYPGGGSYGVDPRQYENGHGAHLPPPDHYAMPDYGGRPNMGGPPPDYRHQGMHPDASHLPYGDPYLLEQRLAAMDAHHPDRGSGPLPDYPGMEGPPHVRHAPMGPPPFNGRALPKSPRAGASKGTVKTNPSGTDVSSEGGDGAAQQSKPLSGAAARAARQRKRKEVDFVDEKTAKLQRRMVKNRESAARSRQRKQQHTEELETKVQALKERNADLRKRVIDACPPPPDKYAPVVDGQLLRRTRTTAF